MTHVSLNLIVLTLDCGPTARVTLPQGFQPPPPLQTPLRTTQQMLINLQRTMITAAGNWLLLASRRTTPYTPLIASALKVEPVAHRLTWRLSAVSGNGVHHQVEFLHFAWECDASNAVTVQISSLTFNSERSQSHWLLMWIPINAPLPF